jgi:hypothetical protein
MKIAGGFVSAIQNSTVRGLAGDGQEEVVPTLRAGNGSFRSAKPKKSIPPTERGARFPVIPTGNILNAVKQKIRQVGQAKYFTGVVPAVAVRTFGSPLCFRLYPRCSSTLLYSFSRHLCRIFQRARAHPASCLTLSLSIFLSVIQLFL